MTSHSLSLKTGFGDQAIELVCNSPEAKELADFLFADLPGCQRSTDHRQFDLIFSGPLPMISLWNGDKRLYFGTSRYQLAYILMNEVLYYCIDNNRTQHALHAGAVCKKGRCIILPGRSGIGKSTMTAWLLTTGYQYLSDELVFLSEAGWLKPFTRPLKLSLNSDLNQLLGKFSSQSVLHSSDDQVLIPHRLLNQNFTAQEPKLTDIVFPQFAKGAPPVLQKLTAAKSCFLLMQSHVNARNLNGHGISALAAVVKKCNAYRLSYGSFKDLASIFGDTFGPPDQ